MLLIPALLVLGNSAIEWIMNGRITSLSFFVGISMLLVAIQSMGVGVISLLLRRSELRTMRRFSAIMQPNNDGVRQQKFTIAGENVHLVALPMLRMGFRKKQALE